MPFWLKQRLMDEANDGTDGGSGGATSDNKSDEGAEDTSGGKKGEDKSNGKKSSLSDTEHKLLSENMKMKEKNQALETQVKTLGETLKRFEGIDPDAVRNLLEEKQQRETAELEKKGEWERLRENMANQHKTEKAALDAQITDLNGKLSAQAQVINDLTIGSQFSTSQYIKEKLVMPPSKAKVVYGQHFDFVDGKIVGFDKPRGASERTPLVDGSGKPLSFDQAIEALIEADPDKASLLRATVKPGANSDSETKKIQEDKPLEGVNKIAAGLKNLGAKK